KAIVEELAVSLHSRKVTLVVGAKNRWELYDLATLNQFANDLPWVDVIPALSDDPGADQSATAVEAALRSGTWYDRDIYVCGSPSMVAGTCQTLRDQGFSPGNVHVEHLDDRTYAPLRASLTPDGVFEEVTRR